MLKRSNVRCSVAHDPENVRGDDQPDGYLHREWQAPSEHSYTQPTTFGGSVRFHRKNQGLSQKKLAMLSGSSQSHLCKVEQDKLIPKHTTACRIAKVLNRPSLIAIASKARHKRTLAAEARIKQDGLATP